MEYAQLLPLFTIVQAASGACRHILLVTREVCRHGDSAASCSEMLIRLTKYGTTSARLPHSTCGMQQGAPRTGVFPVRKALLRGANVFSSMKNVEANSISGC